MEDFSMRCGLDATVEKATDARLKAGATPRDESRVS